MIVHVGPRTLDELPKGNAGEAAAELAHAYGVQGGAFTLKADGIVLDPGAQVPAGAAVLEVVELASDEIAESPSPLSDEDEAYLPSDS